MRIAVIGAGISGMAAARRLARQHSVALFESDKRAGGHACTVDIELDGISGAVDTGFLVLNERTYPNLLALFAELDIALAPSDMSFSASLRPDGIEWCGSTLASLFAQPANMANARFLRMVVDILRFNRAATALALAMNQGSPASETGREPLGQWLDRQRYGAGFRDWYLLPMAAAIWSCPMHTMRDFPVGSFVRFFHNHGLLQVRDRPQWFTVPGGSRRYVERIIGELGDVRLGTPVLGVSRARLASEGKVDVRSACGTEAFDAVVLATHSPQALALLDDPTEAESAHLGAVRYQSNSAWLHTDTALMPRTRKAWAAWNYLAQAASANTDGVFAGEPRVSLTYWLNRLQPLPFNQPVFVTLNPLEQPDNTKILHRFDYAHPVFDDAALRAQTALKKQQGERATWYAGAWLGYGFHEDGLVSGIEAASHLARTMTPNEWRRAA